MNLEEYRPHLEVILSECNYLIGKKEELSEKDVRENPDVQRAIRWSLRIIGKMVKQIPEEIKKLEPDVPWEDIEIYDSSKEEPSRILETCCISYPDSEKLLPLKRAVEGLLKGISPRRKNLKDLFYEDYGEWVELTLELLNEEKFDELDLEGVMDALWRFKLALSYMVEDHLATILEFTFKWDRYRDLLKLDGIRVFSWIYPYEKAKEELSKLEGVPKKHKEFQLQFAWSKAKDKISSWLIELGIKDENLPYECPYKLDELLERDLRREVEEYFRQRFDNDTNPLPP